MQSVESDSVGVKEQSRQETVGVAPGGSSREREHPLTVSCPDCVPVPDVAELAEFLSSHPQLAKKVRRWRQADQKRGASRLPAALPARDGVPSEAGAGALDDFRPDGVTFQGSGQSGPRVIASRVDAFVVAWRARLGRETYAALCELGRAADREGRCCWGIYAGGRWVEWELRSMGRKMKKGTGAADVGFGKGRFVLRNEDFSCVIDLRAGHPDRDDDRICDALVLEARSTLLARMPVSQVLAQMRLIAESITADRCEDRRAERRGLLGRPYLRRIDLAMDCLGWKFQPDDILRVIKPAVRARVGTISGSVDDWEEVRPDEARLYQSGAGARLTGLVVCPGGDVMLRAYDKTVELGLESRKYKRDLEHHIWSMGGWDGRATVVRAEVQLRGQVLTDLDVRDPSVAISELDSIWQYCVTKWFRMVQPGTASRLRRCQIDPRWAALQSAKFEHSGIAPHVRLRHRGAVTFAQALGCAIAGAVADHQVTIPGCAPTKEWEWVRELVDREGLEAAGERAQVMASEVWSALYRDTVERIKDDPAGMLGKMLVRLRASRGRFSSLFDEESWPRTQKPQRRVE